MRRFIREYWSNILWAWGILVIFGLLNWFAFKEWNIVVLIAGVSLASSCLGFFTGGLRSKIRVRQLLKLTLNFAGTVIVSIILSPIILPIFLFYYLSKHLLKYFIWLEDKFFKVSPIMIIALIALGGFLIWQYINTSKDLEITALMLATYGFAVGAKRLQATLEQRTDRQFSDAVGWLGNANHAVQIGSLYSLEKLGRIRKYKEDIRNILEEYIRVLREGKKEEGKKEEGKKEAIAWIEKRKQIALNILLSINKT